MAQWVNHLQNNIFVNPPPLPLLVDKIQVNFEISKLAVGQNTQLVASFNLKVIPYLENNSDDIEPSLKRIKVEKPTDQPNESVLDSHDATWKGNNFH